MVDGMDERHAGELLARLRRRHRLSQAQLAIRAGTSQAAISRIERGLESPTVDRLALLLQVMGEELTLDTRRMGPWADANDIADERAMTAEDRLEQGIALAEFVTALAASGEARAVDGR